MFLFIPHAGLQQRRSHKCPMVTRSTKIIHSGEHIRFGEIRHNGLNNRYALHDMLKYNPLVQCFSLHLEKYFLSSSCLLFWLREGKYLDNKKKKKRKGVGASRIGVQLASWSSYSHHLVMWTESCLVWVTFGFLVRIVYISRRSLYNAHVSSNAKDNESLKNITSPICSPRGHVQCRASRNAFKRHFVMN